MNPYTLRVRHHSERQCYSDLANNLPMDQNSPASMQHRYKHQTVAESAEGSRVELAGQMDSMVQPE